MWPLGASCFKGTCDLWPDHRYVRVHYMSSFWLAALGPESACCPMPCGRLLQFRPWVPHASKPVVAHSICAANLRHTTIQPLAQDGLCRRWIAAAQCRCPVALPQYVLWSVHWTRHIPFVLLPYFPPNSFKLDVPAWTLTLHTYSPRQATHSS